jgi:flagellar hook protein FlgE
MGFDSLFTGISGLNAYQSQIDQISNDIANVDTTGYKGQDMTFADLFYQSTGFASAPTQTNGGVDPQQIGLGVKINTITTDFSQGGLDTTGINTDLALNGDGFFILGNADGSGEPIYTRDGAFSLNSNGMLYDPATGLAVEGYMANANGQVVPSGTPGAITVPIGLAMQATATGGAGAVKVGPANDQEFDMSLGGSLNETNYATVAAGGTAAPTTLTTTIYDSLGNAHQATITFTAAPPAPPAALPAVDNSSGTAVQAASCWQYTITFADGTTPTNSTGYVFFDQNGQYINSSSSQTGAPVHAIGTAPSAADGNLLTIPVAAAGPPPVGWANGDNAAASNIGLDFSNMTSLATGTGTTTSASVLSQNGFAAGTLSNITIGQDGTITGAFTNGEQKTVGQIALATFQNEDGLSRIGGNGFQQTANSGLAQIGTGNSGRFGAVISGSLEESNVSLADEFTKMIAAQRAFEANTRGISTADQNLQDIIGLRASEN